MKVGTVGIKLVCGVKMDQNPKTGPLVPEPDLQAAQGQSSAIKKGDFAAGDLICDSYQVIDFLGAGAMGNVYRVKHNVMQTEYALKTLSGDKITQVAWLRFQNEAKSIAKLDHPNIVSIYNMDLHGGYLPFYVMDLLDGPSLFDVIYASGPLDLQTSLEFFIEIALALGYAHKKGIVHRDVKPANIVVLAHPEAHCRLKIVDFGIAKLTEIDANVQQLTNAGEVCGSPYYMSPEQTAAAKLDARSDIYSLGCSLYEVLTGRPPFKGRSAVDTMTMHQTDTPMTLEKASGGKKFPEMLESIMQAVLAKSPMDRYQSMELFADDLAAVKNGEQRPVSPFKKYVAEPPRPAQSKAAAPPPNQQLTGRLFVDDDLPVGRRNDNNGDDGEDAPAQAGKQKQILLAVIATALLVIGAVGGIAVWQFQPKKPAATSVTTAATATAASAAKATGNAPDASTAPASPSTEIVSANAFGAVENDEAMANPWQHFADEILNISPDLQKPRTSINDRAKYSKIITIQGRRCRSFDFPTDFAIGKFSTLAHPVMTLAIGDKTVLEQDKVSFAPNPVLIKYPQYFSRFKPGDLDSLTLAGSEASDQLLKAATAIPKIPKLTLFACSKITPHCLATIDAMPGLQGIQITASGPPLRDLLKLKRLRSLEEIGYSGNPETDLLVPALKNDSALKTLDLSFSKLNKESLDIITKLPNLTSLSLNRVPLSESNLEKIAEMPNIESLALQDYPITNHSILVLQRMQKLRSIFVSSKSLGQLSQERFQKLLPRVRVVFGDSAIGE
ncbi:MAG: protein kinase [Cyanobacteria bacterium REEB67]|nr:protein kinase [Cyanobacteria bacterium REEB67]